MKVGHPFKIAKSANDEYYTPSYAIEPLKKYLKNKSKIWCPFDIEKSLYIKEFEKEGHEVVATHIDKGENFFDLNIDCDYIISNPPYTIKMEILERLFELNKPFAMLVGVVGLFDSKKKADLFKHNDFEIMYLSPRISYFKDYDNPEPVNGTPYQSVYICKGILPKQIVFEEIKKN